MIFQYMLNKVKVNVYDDEGSRGDDDDSYDVDVIDHD